MSRLNGLIMQRNELERRLERLEDSGDDESKLYRTLDGQLDELISEINVLEEQDRKAREARATQLAREFAEITKLNSERVIMKAMVEEFGTEMISDYIIDEQYTVYSNARKCEYFGDSKSWECSDMAEANTKVYQLVYWRVYNHYFRHGCTPEHLTRLKERIIIIKSR